MEFISSTRAEAALLSLDERRGIFPPSTRAEKTTYRCHHHFGHRGGAVAFSLGRARALGDALIARGVEKHRIECVGLAGSGVKITSSGQVDAFRWRFLDARRGETGIRLAQL